MASSKSRDNVASGAVANSKSRDNVASRQDVVTHPSPNNQFRLQKIYIVATLFLTLGVLQLAAVKCVQVLLIDSLALPNFMWIFITLVCLLLLVFTELYNKFPINWTLGLVAVESVTICAVSYKWNTLPALYAACILTAVTVINIILYALGSFLPIVALPGYYAMLYITIVFIVVYVFLYICIFAVAMPNLRVLTNLWGFLYMIPLILYTVTLIHQRRLPDMVSEEYVLSATVMAAFFMFMIFLLTNCIYFICKLAKVNYNCFLHN